MARLNRNVGLPVVSRMLIMKWPIIAKLLRLHSRTAYDPLKDPDLTLEAGGWRRVYAYIASFAPDVVVGIQRDGAWYLPGGLIQHDNDITGFPQTGPKHFDELVGYVYEQTGLTLLGLTDAEQIALVRVADGKELRILYRARAAGPLSKGVRLNLSRLPKFHESCGEPESLLGQGDPTAAHITSEPPSKAREHFHGVYVSQRPIGNADNGDPCHSLLRFYEDGTVLGGAVCSHDLEKDWGALRQWFHTHSDAELGRGTYTLLEDNHLTFNTVCNYRAPAPVLLVVGDGDYTRERLTLRMYGLEDMRFGKWHFLRLNVDTG